MEHEIELSGMNCTNCADGIERFLRSEPGVEQADVDYETSRGTIAVTADADVDALVDAVERMGYGAEVVESG